MGSQPKADSPTAKNPAPGALFPPEQKVGLKIKKSKFMEEKTKKTNIIIIIAGLIVIGGGIWWYQHQEAVNLCKKRCYYGAKEEIVSPLFERQKRTQVIKGWLFADPSNRLFTPGRIFPTREECIDYCMAVR